MRRPDLSRLSGLIFTTGLIAAAIAIPASASGSGGKSGWRFADSCTRGKNGNVLCAGKPVKATRAVPVRPTLKAVPAGRTLKARPARPAFREAPAPTLKAVPAGAPSRTLVPARRGRGAGWHVAGAGWHVAHGGASWHVVGHGHGASWQEAGHHGNDAQWQPAGGHHGNAEWQPAGGHHHGHDACLVPAGGGHHQKN